MSTTKIENEMTLDRAHELWMKLRDYIWPKRPAEAYKDRQYIHWSYDPNRKQKITFDAFIKAYRIKIVD